MRSRMHDASGIKKKEIKERGIPLVTSHLMGYATGINESLVL